MGFLIAQEVPFREIRKPSKEKDFYNGFSNFSKRDFLSNLSSQSEIAHMNFLRELNKFEKNLQLIV